MNLKKKISIIGPINDRGGREIEVGFIASLLSENYQVQIVSTERISINNDVLGISPTTDIYGKYLPLWLKIIKRVIKFNNSSILYFKSLKSGNSIRISKVIKNSDIIFIVAQIYSHHLKFIIEFAKANNKKVIFRTTGKIEVNNRIDFKRQYLAGVDMFIHHSKSNALTFYHYFKHNYQVIDQCVVNESEFVRNLRSRKKIKRFYCCSRLDENKDIATVVKAFNQLEETNLELHIYGNGVESNNLKSLAYNKNIFFHGHVSHKELLPEINKNDCLIISSIEEAGPFVSIEAMCLGILIISTDVGSMKERFNEFDFMWFKSGDWESLLEKIVLFSKFEEAFIINLQNQLKIKYINIYSKKVIGNKYLDIVNDMKIDL